MTVWQKPTFEELAMNAEIGAYQPEYGDDERRDEPFLQAVAASPPAPAASVFGG